MIELNISERKKIQINLLNEIKKICEKNKIKYFLAYGTLLGAVRHKGFIPWDDDVDIFLFREEYDKLIEILKKNKSNNYKFISNQIDNYYFPYVKISDLNTIAVEQNCIFKDGLWIDIFPLDYVPLDKKNQKRFLKKCNFIRNCTIAMNTDFSKENNISRKYLRYFLNIICRIYGRNKIKIKYDKLIKKYKNKYVKEKNALICNLCSPYIYKDVFEKKDLIEQLDFEFEGEKYTSVKNYDFYLNKIYGDYMKLPPIDKRVSHGVTVYRKEKNEK